jgi:protein involved in polysaccharide export with SLBB domain
METLKVFVTGQVTTPGAEPYQPDLTVADYLLYAGGIDENTADPKGLYLISLSGTKTKVTPDQTVPPGSNLYVAKKPLFQANQFFQNFFITTGWVTAIVGAIEIVYKFLLLVHVL